MATTLEIIRGISQAASMGYDGALDEEGNRIKIGLKRDEGHPIHDSRVMDGFKVQFHGNKLCIKYHAEIRLKELHNPKFESEIKQTYEDIASFLKKEYKKVTGNSLTLTKEGDLDIEAQSMSKIRNWIQCFQMYKIGGISDVEPLEANREANPTEAFQKFLKGE
tara:strand:- start:97 stop:588 length:492 start_codon:yes stop_codon:yes gene_type:complete